MIDVYRLCNHNVATIGKSRGVADAAALMREDSSIDFALREMRRHGGRRAPVVRANGDLVGVIAADDILEHAAKQLSRLPELIQIEQQAEQRKRH